MVGEVTFAPPASQGARPALPLACARSAGPGQLGVTGFAVEEVGDLVDPVEAAVGGQLADEAGVLRDMFRQLDAAVGRLSTTGEAMVCSADRILVFHKGRLREEGAHQELLAQRGIYYRLYQLQYKEQELHNGNGAQTLPGSSALPAPLPATD